MENSQEAVKPGRMLEVIAHIGLWLSVLLLMAISVLVAGQVLLRNVFSMGLPWADELARWFGVSLVFLTIPYLLLGGKHIAIGFLPNMLRGRARIVALAVSELAVAGFAAILIYGFWEQLERAAWFRTPALSLPNLVFYMPALVGIVLLGLVALGRLAGLVKLWVTG